ncbi:MAG TPA: peptidylprolyl isomerase [Casimicrobiaceae bacterium]|jgi:peptidyl-prolyl cis-trans isomerase SurA
MTAFAIARITGVAVLAYAAVASAQTQPPTQPMTPAAAPAAAPRTTTVPLDRVIAVVNDEALTQWDLREQRRIVLDQLKASNVPAPSSDVLDKQVLERLITERALTQFAKETGIRVDDTTVERTILRIAEENKLSPDDFRKVLEKENIPYANYREDIRRQVVMQRLRDREVDSKILVTDAEVDNYLATVTSQAGGEREYSLSHIYVSVPEQASAELIETRRRRAEEALGEIKSGKEFAQVAASYSDAPDATSGGSLGWRTPARLPSIFADPALKMKAGDVSAVLRSPAGFHVFKIVEIRNRDQATVVDQSHALHILIKVNEATSEAEGKVKIERLRERIVGGAKFEDLARVNSEDATSAKGGDLGWISPGDTVPDFERAMDKLALNEVSAPVRTPFGWHLIEVLGRRKQDITQERHREQARQALRQRKSEEQFQEFVRQTRDRAYVEYKIDER